uniref:Elongin-C n=1 Tax=Caenorhabditis tropicalis TaxID=1561998 RepID=A0A1I7URK5_9PELO
MSAGSSSGEGTTTDQFTKLKLIEEEKEGEKKEEQEDSQEGSSSTEPVKYPGVTGENSVYVKLVSSDDHEYYIRRELAEKSSVIRDMLRTPSGNEENTVHLHMVDSRILRTMCRYLTYQKDYIKKQGEIEQFKIPSDDAYELLLVAGFFGI